MVPDQARLAHPRVDTARFYPLRAHVAEELSEVETRRLLTLWTLGFTDQLKALAEDPQADADLLTIATDIALFVAQTLHSAKADGDRMEA